MTETDDFVAQGWYRVFERVRSLAAEHGAHLAATVVLLPYAQLMPEAQRQWQRCYPQSFAPRFETTRNWSQTLGAALPAAGEFTGDVALDALTARRLLIHAGFERQGQMLLALLLETAAQLATVLAAVPPAGRADWGDMVRGLLPGVGEGVLRLEAATARIALEWVLVSRHASDALFASGVRAAVDMLIVVEGVQPDPLAQALLEHWGRASDCIVWTDVLKQANNESADMGRVALHPTCDSEDEAGRAAACVMAHLEAGRSPVALAAGDRALTRRIIALLEGAGVKVHDENGWTLSTTRAAACLMALLRACTWDASADAVLDWLKQSPAVPDVALHALERWLRRRNVRQWNACAAGLAAPIAQQPVEAGLAAQVQAWRAPWRAARSLKHWLQTLQSLLHECGLWQMLEQDDAGQRVLLVLRLTEGQDADVCANDSFQPRNMDLQEFMHWVHQVLEAARFRPTWRSGAPVVVLPLAQLLARSFAALVLPGCDEKRLPAAPEPQGMWTLAQRQVLGLPTRVQLSVAQRAAWHYALRISQVDILWREGDEGGEALLASPLVLALQRMSAVSVGQDARSCRKVQPTPVSRPEPSAAQLPVHKLSSTAYADLRHCPYRFFAQRQLRLSQEEEIDAELDKRDFGTWLHAVLEHFHTALCAMPHASCAQRIALMDEAAARATKEQRLHESDFLPWASGWPVLRDGYLHWLAGHEAKRGVFCRAEVRASQPLGALELVGTIDRMDTVDGVLMVIDYKTESSVTTRQRVQADGEDIQLAFYAALLPQEHLRAAYVNVGERGDTCMYEHPDVLALREQLVIGIQSDITRIAQGAPLPALGQGRVCDWCAVRGLCRKDFWQ